MQYKIGEKVWYRHHSIFEGKSRKAIYEAFIVDIIDDYFVIRIGYHPDPVKANTIEVKGDQIKPRKK